MKKLAMAIGITADAFLGKTDMVGKPYFTHCYHVMTTCGSTDEDVLCAAIMHDLIEDCEEWTLDRLWGRGFSAKTITIVDLMTHRPEDDYMTYIRKIATNKDATAVKLADLRHNSDITRMKGVTAKDMARLEKYNIAYKYLSQLP